MCPVELFARVDDNGTETEGDAIMVTVMIVDDHDMVRQGIRMFLALDPTIDVIGEADNGESAVRLAAALRPNVILMDILMPGMDGVTTTAAIKEVSPESAVLALTGSVEARTVVGAIRAGAKGYLPKSIEAEDLRKAVHAVTNGMVQLAPEAATFLVQDAQSQDKSTVLSNREMSILRILVAGNTNREIGTALHIGEKTVKTHMSSIMQKLNVQSRTQAALIAVQRGIVPAVEPTRTRDR